MGARLRAYGLFAFALGFIACSSGPNTQNLPIGERCTSDGQCGTQPYVCSPVVAGKDYPGGYCTLACTAPGTNCPTDSECVVLAGDVSGYCMRKCDTDTECRTDEGYSCETSVTTSTETTPYCDVTSTS